MSFLLLQACQQKNRECILPWASLDRAARLSFLEPYPSGPGGCGGGLERTALCVIPGQRKKHLGFFWKVQAPLEEGLIVLEKEGSGAWVGERMGKLHSQGWQDPGRDGCLMLKGQGSNTILMELCLLSHVWPGHGGHKYVCEAATTRTYIITNIVTRQWLWAQTRGLAPIVSRVVKVLERGQQSHKKWPTWDFKQSLVCEESELDLV